MTKQSRLMKWGNSLALRIPAYVAKELGIVDGTKVDIQREGTGFRITVIK